MAGPAIIDGAGIYTQGATIPWFNLSPYIHLEGTKGNLSICIVQAMLHNVLATHWLLFRIWRLCISRSYWALLCADSYGCMYTHALRLYVYIDVT